jgi:cyclophilin family peptidyl-prolyl cis-trans isomerase
VALALGLGTGARWRWKIITEHGGIEIDLDSSAAPWHVAAIVALTQKHFYDGLEFHRVVPNFVVQGGDPTQSGSGGPGFVLPAEPGSRLDGDSYRAGAIGFADAGKDSGGSQWFVMHSRAPHLEGRYTRVGQLVSGQAVADRLLVGDKVVTAQVTARPR